MSAAPRAGLGPRARAWFVESYGFVREYLAAVERHALFSHAAATAFFLFFSLPPLALTLVTLLGLVPVDRIVGLSAGELLERIAGLLERFLPIETALGLTYYISLRMRPLLLEIEEFGAIELRERLQGLLERALPSDAAEAIGGIVTDILGSAHPGLLTLSFVSILWASTAASRATSRAMNVIYEVRVPGFFRPYLKSLLMTLAIVLGFVVALVVFPLLQGLILGVGALLRLGAWFAWIGVALGWFFQLLLLVYLVMLLQRVGPRAPHSLRSVVAGSVLTVLLWLLLFVGLGYWASFGWERYNATYGTLAGVILLLLWCYLASLALLSGAELNALRWRHGGARRELRRRRERRRKRAARARAASRRAAAHA